MSGTYRFADTNVLVYAHDDSAGARRDQARLLAGQLRDSREGCLSVQVLQEFFVTVTRKIARPLSPETAEEIVADLSRWHVHVPAAGDVLGAIGMHQRAGISFRDAMIVRSAPGMGCAVLYPDDLNAGREYSGIRVENPFQPPGTAAGTWQGPSFPGICERPPGQDPTSQVKTRVNLSAGYAS